MQERMLRPGVAPAEQPDRGAVALHDRVAGADDVPEADRHVLGLDDLPGMCARDVAARGQLGDLVGGSPAKSPKRVSGSARSSRCAS